MENGGSTADNGNGWQAQRGRHRGRRMRQPRRAEKASAQPKSALSPERAQSEQNPEAAEGDLTGETTPSLRLGLRLSREAGLPGRLLRRLFFVLPLVAAP